METDSGGNVKIKIGMMHAMKSPEKIQFVEIYMLSVDCKIHQNNNRQLLQSSMAEAANSVNQFPYFLGSEHKPRQSAE